MSMKKKEMVEKILRLENKLAQLSEDIAILRIGIKAINGDVGKLYVLDDIDFELRDSASREVFGEGIRLPIAREDDDE
ncbi:MAG: hypothetical protein UR84_C0024G0006 [candidate division WS6 bacterium GW2011_GWD1_35_594]|nr:MAG: hypothetical protein UR84_C0024G0006 [candidate division WS6 bacterium GW2011_GWD1_35_594]